MEYNLTLMLDRTDNLEKYLVRKSAIKTPTVFPVEINDEFILKRSLWKQMRCTMNGVSFFWSDLKCVRAIVTI